MAWSSRHVKKWLLFTHFEFSVAERPAARAEGHLVLDGRPPARSRLPCNRSQVEHSFVSPAHNQGCWRAGSAAAACCPPLWQPLQKPVRMIPLLCFRLTSLRCGHFSVSVFRYHLPKLSGPSESMREIACVLKAPYFLFQKNLPKWITSSFTLLMCAYFLQRKLRTLWFTIFKKIVIVTMPFWESGILKSIQWPCLTSCINLCWPYK